MRICIVTHALVTTDGQGRINYEIVRHLSKKGHTFVLVSTLADPALVATPGVTWHHVPLPKRVPTRLLKYMVFARRARRVVDTNGPYDILQVNGDIVGGDSDVNIAMFVHSNWIKSPLHPTYQSAGWRGLYQLAFTRAHARWERRAFGRARAAVALSASVEQSLITDLGLPAGKIEVIMPGVDVEQFRPLRPGEPNRLRECVGASADDFMLIFAGDLISNRKNVDLVFNAMAVVAGTRVVLAGNYATSPYPALAKKLGIENRVHFIGKRNDLELLFRGANCFAFPSHYDTFALVLTEAMASGIAVITAPSVGAACFVNPGVSGIILKDSRDLQGLIEALSRMVADRSYAAGLGKAARAAAEAWTWSEMASRYEELYTRLGKQNASKCG